MKGKTLQADRRQRARDKRKDAGRTWKNPPDDGVGAFPPIAEDTPGQDESRDAFERFNDGRDKCPWWVEYLGLAREGWDWRKAALIAWLASPTGRRWPKTQHGLATEVLGLAGDRVLRKWREDDPAIDERVGRMQVEPLFRHRRDVIDALIAVAQKHTHLAHQDRELFLKMTGDYKPTVHADLGAEPANDIEGVTDGELVAIEGALRETVASGSRRNTAIFCRVWRHGVRPGAHQYDMAKRIDDEVLRFQGDFWPRDHGKSELFCIGYPLRRICEDPNVRILIVQKTATEAEKTLSVIKTELESNEGLKRYYAPHWRVTVGARDISNATGAINREGRKESAWQRRRIYVKRSRIGKDPTIEAVGVGGAITGGHFDVIILDDVEDDENTRTPDRLESLREWFTGTIMQLREPHTKIVVVGTLKTMAQDIYNFILTNPVWSTVVRSAILRPALDEIEYEATRSETGLVTGVTVKTPGVQTLWPGKWPIEALLFEMLSSIRSIWIREKLNDLRALAGRVFKREWFGYYEQRPAALDEVVQAWDTAYDESSQADWSVCVTLGRAKGIAYVLDVFRARLEFPALKEAMKTQFERWKPRAVVVEAQASGKSAIQVLRQETGLPILAVSPEGRDKASRARAMTPYYESHRVLHRSGAAWLDVFEDELTQFPDAEHDDQVDALVYGLRRLFLGEAEERTVTAPAQVVSRDAVFG